jgi:hypothetical protein
MPIKSSRGYNLLMQKPFNRAAIVLWVLCALYVVVNAAYLGFYRTSLDLWIGHFRYVFVEVGQLFAIAVLIELVDQIRWNALPAEKRIPSERTLGRAFRDTVRYLRGRADRAD